MLAPADRPNDDALVEYLRSREDRLDIQLLNHGGHLCLRWPRLEAAGGIQYLGQELHIASRDQKGVRVPQAQ